MHERKFQTSQCTHATLFTSFSLPYENTRTRNCEDLQISTQLLLCEHTRKQSWQVTYLQLLLCEHTRKQSWQVTYLQLLLEENTRTRLSQDLQGQSKRNGRKSVHRFCIGNDGMCECEQLATSDLKACPSVQFSQMNDFVFCWLLDVPATC